MQIASVGPVYIPPSEASQDENPPEWEKQKSELALMRLREKEMDLMKRLVDAFLAVFMGQGTGAFVEPFAASNDLVSSKE